VEVFTESPSRRRLTKLSKVVKNEGESEGLPPCQYCDGIPFSATRTYPQKLDPHGRSEGRTSRMETVLVEDSPRPSVP
jgi:hypothetical protein